MNRLDTALAARKAEGRKALVPFITAGDPDPELQRVQRLRVAALAGGLLRAHAARRAEHEDPPPLRTDRAPAAGGGARGRLRVCREWGDLAPAPLRERYAL